MEAPTAITTTTTTTTTGTNEDIKPTAVPPASDKSNPAHIQVTLAEQSGQELSFRVRPTHTFEKIINAFCKARHASVTTYRFLYDGQRINGKATMTDLGMEDGDMIDVMMNQTGGR